MKQRGTTKVASDTGLWATVPSARPGSEETSAEGVSGAPISWLPRPKLSRRMIRSINVPTAVGVAAFVFALVVTSWIMVRGMVVESNDVLDSTLAAPQPLTAGHGEEASPAAPGAPTIAIVHVVGEVERPGVVTVPGDSRVRDAIEAAGGATDSAVLTAINLARTVSDGEQILVPDAEMVLEIAAGTVVPGGASGNSAQAGSGAHAGSGGIINLNAASADELTQLPKIGPAIAQRIVDWREANGGFGTVEQLLEVSGIGAKTLAVIRDRVRV